MHDNKKWSGRFTEPVAELVKKYTGSINFDKKLARVDIEGSLAHAQMLQESGVISEHDLKAIQVGLNDILQMINSDDMPWSLDLEDVHMNIEKILTDKIGDAGKRLHTGRSRNDQVATDIRLWLRGEIHIISECVKNLQRSLLILAEKNVNTIMPGFTHLQVAQPVSFAHHLLAYVEMLARDDERLQDCLKRVNSMPLGAAALAGTTFPIDRKLTAELLGFERICENSLDAVSDRDFAIEFSSAASLIMIHLSRLSEELIMWMSPRFAFIDIADRFCTGSSIMPQKKNPDVPELVRAKTARVVGNLMDLILLMKAQPLAYNRDNQEDKEPLFDSVDTLIATLTIYADMILAITPKPDNMYSAVLQGYATATDLADYLVKRGVPFRESHGVVARAVKKAEEEQCDLADLSLSVLQEFSPLIQEDVYQILTPEGSMAQRDHLGGTAPKQVNAQINKWKNKLYQ
ncbi:MAG: argininosuccinate lyase [Neisseriaceae bacterium]|nr:MAG: argininosuccinate lyase [Neisseriaceae bacterium]